jgi:hypothetical protein
MLRSLLILLFIPVLSFAQKEKLYATVDGSYGTEKIHSANISAGFIKKGFHFGIGGGVQMTPVEVVNGSTNLVSYPIFAEIGFMKAKLPFLTVRVGKAELQNSSRKVLSYSNARLGMPFRLTKDFYISPFFYTMRWKLEIKPNQLYGYIPLNSSGFGVMLSKF